MIDQTMVLAEAMSLASEDWMGLYELLWNLNRPEAIASESERLTAATAAIRKLVEDGLVEIAIATWSPESFQTVPSEEAIAAIAQPEAWKPASDREDGKYFAFALTTAGMRAYFEPVHKGVL